MIDAYDLQQELLKSWQQVAYRSDSASINKEFRTTPVYVNGQTVTGIKIENNKIILETE